MLTPKNSSDFGHYFCHPLGKKIRLHIYWTPQTRADAHRKHSFRNTGYACTHLTSRARTVFGNSARAPFPSAASFCEATFRRGFPCCSSVPGPQTRQNFGKGEKAFLHVPAVSLAPLLRSKRLTKYIVSRLPSNMGNQPVTD